MDPEDLWDQEDQEGPAEKKYSVVKVYQTIMISAYKKQMCLLPWGQHHHFLLSHQEDQEAPEDDKNE